MDGGAIATRSLTSTGQPAPRGSSLASTPLLRWADRRGIGFNTPEAWIATLLAHPYATEFAVGASAVPSRLAVAGGGPAALRGRAPPSPFSGGGGKARGVIERRVRSNGEVVCRYGGAISRGGTGHARGPRHDLRRPQLGHGADQTLCAYGHVIGELEDSPQLPAEEAIARRPPHPGEPTWRTHRPIPPLAVEAVIDAVGRRPDLDSNQGPTP
jgi:hypothetical protein